jgi:hypothetical protein
MGGTPFFPVDSDRLPTMVTARLHEQSFLGVQGIAVDLRSAGYPEIGYSSHVFVT